MYTTHRNQTEEVSVWPKVVIDWSENESDAEKDRLGKCQLAQHMEAFLLCHKEARQKTPLTERLMKDIYRTLMKGLKTEDDAWIDAGNYCQKSTHAGDYVFLEHKYIPNAMSKVVTCVGGAMQPKTSPTFPIQKVATASC